MVDYTFVDCHISKDNIGEHDFDNSFCAENMEHQIEKFYETHEGCTIVGICYEDPHPYYKGYYPLVFEDENGNRFYTHWNVGTFKEYVSDGLIKLPKGDKNDTDAS